MSTVRTSLSFSLSGPQLTPFPTAYDDGRSQLLLCLHGTLPITFRQASYNIPVAIWVARDYPKDHPIPYVVATPGMLIRSSQYIDLSGRCNIEYIQNWQRKSEVRDYPFFRSPDPTVDSRVAISSVSWRPCKPTSPKSLRSTRNPRILQLSILPPRPTVTPQNPHPRSLACHQTNPFHPPHHHRDRPRCQRLTILADQPFPRSQVRHHPDPSLLRLRKFSSQPFPRYGIPRE